MHNIVKFHKLRLVSSAMAFFIVNTAWSSAIISSALSATISHRSIPDPLYGVTMDAVHDAQLPAILESLEKLAYKATTRVVFDEYVDPDYYTDAVAKIHQVSYVMGEILDSLYFEEYTIEDYLKRTEDYLDALGSIVDIWEIGNEINRDGLGDTFSVIKKITGAYERIKQREGRSALTLYYNQGCFKNEANEMFE
jgi:hypothetical protein